MSESERAFLEWFHGMFCCDSECLCATNEYPALKESWQAAMEHAARVAESYAELHDNCFENARTKDTTETMEVHACHANAGREIEAKLRGRDE